jgi:hypothetical protein
MAMVTPALESLRELIGHADSDSVRLAAAKYVLEYAGFKVTTKLESDGEVTIRIVHDSPSLDYLTPHANGHTRVPA